MLGALTGLVGSLMALEVIRVIVPFGDGLVGRLLLVDARSMRFETLAYGWDPDNPLNGVDARPPDPGPVAYAAERLDPSRRIRPMTNAITNRMMTI